MTRVFDTQITANKKVQSFYKKAMKELCSFYNLYWTENTPIVYIIQNREEFDNLVGEKTEDWNVGTTMGSNNTVYLLSPKVYETESCHKYSDNEYFMLLKHELSHLFCQYYFDSYTPNWLVEGIAVFSSGQLIKYEKPKEFCKFLNSFNDSGSEVFTEGGYAAQIIYNELGKDKFLELLKNIPIPVTEVSFKKYLKKNYNIDLTYKWFNERL